MARADTSERSRFEAAFEAYYRQLLAYALRRTGSQVEAEDAVADTFTIAWRRIAELPEADGTLPWLYAVARRVIANQRRATQRRFHLLRRAASEARPQADPAPSEAGPALAALARLRPDDQELLRLVAWEELDHGEIAIALGISRNAVAIRLHRARARFENELNAVAESRGMKGFARSRTDAPWKGRRSDQAGESLAP